MTTAANCIFGRPKDIIENWTFDIPEGVTHYSLKFEEDDFATVWLWFDDKVEHWILKGKDGVLTIWEKVYQPPKLKVYCIGWPL